MNDGVESLIELIFLVIMIVFIFIEVDTNLIIEVATLYLAAVIRHTGAKGDKG